MDTSISTLLTTEKIKGYVCPFIGELVDSLYTEELNKLIDKTCESEIDKRTFMMFIMMYFLTYINTIDIKDQQIDKNIC